MTSFPPDAQQQQQLCQDPGFNLQQKAHNVRDLVTTLQAQLEYTYRENGDLRRQVVAKDRRISELELTVAIHESMQGAAVDALLPHWAAPRAPFGHR